MTLNRFGTLVAAIVLGVGCTRKVDAPARVSFSVAPSVMSKSGVSAMSLELTRLMVNVTKPGQPTVVIIRDSHETNSSISSDVEIEVPSGNDQLLQVLAVYEESNSDGMSFYYHDVTLNLTGGLNEINMTLQQIGSSSGVEGRVVGRYALPGPTYPTAKLEVVYNPGPGRQPMVVADGEIVGGWFNLFLLDDIRMTYRFKESKLPLSFTTNYSGGVRTESSNVKLSDFTAVTYTAGVFPGIGIVDLSAETSMYRTHVPSGAGEYEAVTPFKVIYGFHGGNSALWSSRWVKFYDSSTTTFTSLKSLAKDMVNDAADCGMVDIVSSVTVDNVLANPMIASGPYPCSIDATTVSYMAFTSTMSSGTCASGCSHAFNLKLVSGVDSVIDVIKVYKSSTMSSDEARGGDYPNCEKLSNDARMSLIGTIGVTPGTTNYNNNSIPFDAADTSANNPVAICPVDSSGKFLPGAVVLQSSQFFY